MEGHGAGEVMLAPALPVLGMREGCDAGESFAHGHPPALGIYESVGKALMTGMSRAAKANSALEPKSCPLAGRNGGRGTWCNGQEFQRGDESGFWRGVSGHRGTERWVSPGLAAAAAEEKQGFSSRLSSGQLQNKGKLCKTSCRRTLVLNRHVVCAAKAPAQGERDLISFSILPFDCKSSQSTSCPGAGAASLGTPSLPTSYPAPR